MRAVRRILVCAVSALLCVVGAPMPTATATVGLVPGMKIFIGNGSCSLGFLATNNDHARLAVTAGHCADDIDQQVSSDSGVRIGEVVYHMPDDMKNGAYGATVIHLYKNTYTSDAYFAVFGNPSVGDYVKKYGARTAKTEGKITSIETDTDNPRYSEMESTLVDLPGDSGSAWVGNSTEGPKLVGLNIGYTTRRDGGYGFAIGFPIRSLIALVKIRSKNWGQGFIPEGR